MPRGPVPASFHFALGPNGAERHHGRPANLPASAIRARRDLAAAARAASADEPGIDAHTFEVAA